MNTCIVCNLRTTIRMDQLFRIFWHIKVHLLISSDIKCSIISISYYIYHVCMQLLFEDNDPFYATFFSPTCDEYDKMLQMCDTFFKLDRCKLHGPTCCCCYSNSCIVSRNNGIFSRVARTSNQWITACTLQYLSEISKWSDQRWWSGQFKWGLEIFG